MNPFAGPYIQMVSSAMPPMNTRSDIGRSSQPTPNLSKKTWKAWNSPAWRSI